MAHLLGVIEKNESLNFKLKEAVKEKKKIYSLLRRSTIKKLAWKTDIGVGEADQTGLIFGGLWMIKSFIINYLYHNKLLEIRPKLSICPFFNEKTIQSKMDCMITIRLGQAIYTMLKGE